MSQKIGWRQHHVEGGGVANAYKKVAFSTKPTFDWRIANFQEMTLLDTVTCVHFNNPDKGAKLDLLLRQGCSTGVAVSGWPTCVLWLGRTAPTIGLCPGYADMLRFDYNGINFWGTILHDAGPSA